MQHTIIAVDVEKFGSRKPAQQKVIRQGLAAVMEQTLAKLNFTLSSCQPRDDGDGMILLVPQTVENSDIVANLPHLLGMHLREYNDGVGGAEGQIRLRAVLHAGEVEHDSQGITGESLVHTARMLNSKALRKALANSNGTVALMTTAEFYREHIENKPPAEPERYWSTRVREKEYKARAWVCQPDHHVRRREHWWQRLRSERTESERAGSEPESEPQSEAQHRPTVPPVKRRVPTFALLVVALLLVGPVGNWFGAAPLDDRCVEPVQLNVNVSVEKAAVIQKLMPMFEDRTRAGNDGCKAVNVQVTVARTADPVIAALGRAWGGEKDLEDVGPEPHVVLPDSSWEIAAANAAVRRDEHTDDITLDNWGSIARSPLVFATPAAEGLPDAVDQLRSWSEVLDAAQRSLPDSGVPRVRRPSPVSSGTGLAATVALYAAALQQDLNRRHLIGGDASRRLHDVERSVVAGEGSGTMLCSLREQSKAAADSAGAPAVLVSEKAAADYNEGSALGDRCSPEPIADAPQLGITYPREGTVYLDHPFVAVGWPRKPANSRRAGMVRELHAFLTGPLAQSELADERFRNLNGDIAPYGGAPQGRPPTLPIDSVDVPALLQAFEGARKSARVLFLLDTSVAMAEPFRDVGGTRLRASADAVNDTLRSVGAHDQLGVWVVAEGLAGAGDHRVLVPLDRYAGTDAGRQRATLARERLKDLTTTERPARLNNALRAAMDKFRVPGKSSVDTRDAVVLMTDGADAAPGQAQLVDYLESLGRPVPVFLVAFGAGACNTVWWKDVVLATGGDCFSVAGAADIKTGLDRVTATLWGEGS
ncbi:MAG TPA: substrate-binding domain-containing protein [Actinophytocola sp.]|nr:substrate-binding domain-containing protein [Actinophytocola sp.]